MKKLSLLVSVYALSFTLGACSDEQETSKTEAQKTQAVVASAKISDSTTDRTADTIAKELGIDYDSGSLKKLQEQKVNLSKSLDEFSQSLKEMGDIYEQELDISQEKINKVAGQLGKLAKQAGEGARVLETTTQTLGQAIQQGFEEGYNKAKTAEQKQAK